MIVALVSSAVVDQGSEKACAMSSREMERYGLACGPTDRRKATSSKLVMLITEWIKLISAQSNTVCEESSKKTISPEHVLEALKVSAYLLEQLQLSVKVSSLTTATRLRIVHL